MQALCAPRPLLVSQSLAKRRDVSAASKMEKLEAGLRIRKFRDAKGLSQAEMQRRCGFESPRLHKYESGKSYPNPKAWREMARVLGVSIDSLMGVHVPDFHITEAEQAEINLVYPSGASRPVIEAFVQGLRRPRTQHEPTAAPDAVAKHRADAAEEWEAASGQPIDSSRPPPMTPSKKKKRSQ